jgi:hypothetical protein
MPMLTEAELEANPQVRALVAQLAAIVGGLTKESDGFETYEAMTLLVSNVVDRLALKGRLQTLAESFAEDLLVDGKEYHRHQEGTDVYHSLCGPLEVRRSSYRKSDERNGPTVIPLELAAGLVEGATPALSYSVALGYGHGELRGYAEGMLAAHRLLPSRSTLERLAKRIGTEARTESATIEPILRKKELLPEGARGISTGLDRVAVPMEEDRPEGAPPKTRRKERTKPYERAQPTPVDVNYRMAYVGTVSIVDAQGEELVTRRYTALPEAEPDEVADRLAADVVNAIRQDRALKVSVLQDGAPELWNAMDRALTKAGVLEYEKTIDRFHLDERLGAALQLVETNEQERKAKLSAWADALDASDLAINDIQAWLSAQLSGLEAKNDDTRTDKYLEHLVYLENNQEKMRYASLREKGLPIGSGLTEGACKSVVGQRTCGSGQRWRPEGIAAVLTLRAIHRSERLPTFWAEFRKGYTAEIRAAARAA